MGIPFVGAELTRADARVLPDDASARVVDQTVRERFPADPTASLLVVLDGTERPGRLGSARAELGALPGVERVSPAERTGRLLLVTARLGDGPYSDAALQTVDEAREIRWGARALISGPSAELQDQRASLREHLPLALAIVLVTTFVALLLMTGSVVLPLLSIFASALTISVALGVLVLVFQDGRFESLLIYTGVDAIDISIPVLLFAVIFGLSTDYTVFLLSRVAEARRGGASDATAIATGLEDTGGIITAAAAAVRGRDGLVRLLPDDLHQGGRDRHVPGGADRRDPGQGAVAPVADAALRAMDVVDAEAPAALRGAQSLRSMVSRCSALSSASTTRSSNCVPDALAKLLAGGLGADREPVHAVGGHRLVGVADGEDRSLERNLARPSRPSG